MMQGVPLEDVDETDSSFLLVTFGLSQQVPLDAVAQVMPLAPPQVVQQAQDLHSLHINGMTSLRDELGQVTGRNANLETVGAP